LNELYLPSNIRIINTSALLKNGVSLPYILLLPQTFFKTPAAKDHQVGR